MSTGAYSLRPVLRAGVALLAVGLIHGVLAGEKVDFQKPSESPATKPGRRPLSLPDESSSSLFPRNGESAPFVSPAPQPSPPPVTRKSMEEQDRQKNWLLYEVGNMRRDTTAEQIFEVDTFGLPQDLRHHSVFERFVEGEQAASKSSQLNSAPEVDESANAPRLNSFESRVDSGVRVQPMEFKSDSFSARSAVQNQAGQRPATTGLWPSKKVQGSDLVFAPAQDRMNEFKEFFEPRNVLKTARDLPGGPREASAMVPPPSPPPNFRAVPEGRAEQWKTRSQPRSSVLDEMNKRITAQRLDRTPDVNEEPVRSKPKPTVLPFPKREF